MSITEAIQLPYAHEVNGDLFEVAKPLLLLGWAEPAVVTARVALERSLRLHLEARDIDVSDVCYKGAGRLSHRLRADRLISPFDHRDTVALNDQLSQAAHGKAVTLFEPCVSSS